MTGEFVYSNLSGRQRGAVLRLAGLVLPGIARVHADVEPFARHWGAANAEAIASGRPLWVALGDSLTQGIGASAPGRGWVGRVRDRLADDGLDLGVVNLGVSGATVGDVLARQLPALQLLDACLVTVMMGSNDLLRPSNRRALPDRFTEVLQQLPAGSLVTTMPNPTAAAIRANRVIRRVAEQRGLLVADLRDPRMSSWRGRLAADHFHPNDAGYEVIADVLRPFVSRAAHRA